MNKSAWPLIRELLFRVTVVALAIAGLGRWIKGIPIDVVVVIILLFEVPAIIVCGFLLFGQMKKADVDHKIE